MNYTFVPPGMSVVGTCSICGGMVLVHTIWHCVVPDTPTCASCGAIAAPHGPTIPMIPAPKIETSTSLRIDTP